MIIKSPFKDYYDFVAHQFGGGDPKVVYVRDRLKPLREMGSLRIADPILIPHNGVETEDQLPYSHKIGVYYEWLVVCGKRYLLKRESGPGKDDKARICKDLLVRKKVKYRWQEREYEHKPYSVGGESKFFLELSREIKQPVFKILGDYYLNRRQVAIDSEIPILADTGIQSLVDPYQMYQDIAYFIGNTLNENPDIAPPVAIGEKDRIVAHGFDLKRSFRHRR